MSVLPDNPIANNNNNINRLQPMPFVWIGKPLAGGVLHQQLTEYSTIPKGFVMQNDFDNTMAGIQAAAYANTAPTSTATFTVNYIRPSVSLTAVNIGTIVLTAGSKYASTLTAATQTKLQPGDILQVVAPGTQDASMADVAVTVVTYAS